MLNHWREPKRTEDLLAKESNVASAVETGYCTDVQHAKKSFVCLHLMIFIFQGVTLLENFLQKVFVAGNAYMDMKLRGK